MSLQKPKRSIRWSSVLAGIVLAVVVIAGLAFILHSVPGRVQTGQVALSSPIETPQPTDLAPPAEAFPAHLTEAEIIMTLLPPTETPAPMPTLTATLVVTPIPLAQPPYISDLPQEAQNYTLLLRDGQVLRALDRESATERVVVDISAQTSLLLAEQQDWVFPFEWGVSSPVGPRAALVLVRRATTKGELSHYSIYLLDSESGQLEELVENGRTPAWSPDGSRIAYRAVSVEEVPRVLIDGNRTITGTQRVLTEELRVVDVATKATTMLFTIKMGPDSEHRIGTIQWSHSGDRIAFVQTHYASIRSGAVWTVPADGTGKATALTPMDMYAGAVSWSPNDKQIVIMDAPVWIVDVDTGERKELPLTQHMTICCGGPVWIADSQWIAFTGVRWFEYETYPSYDLWIVNVQDGRLQRLTRTDEETLYPTWIPNTTKLLFLEQGVGIWELDLQSGARTQVYSKDVEYLVIPAIRR